MYRISLVLLLLFTCGPRHASGQSDSDKKGVLFKESRKLIRYVDSLGGPKRNLDDISDYASALIATEQMDKALEFIKGDFYALEHSLWSYCGKMRSLGRSIELAKQLEELETELAPVFEFRRFEYKDKFDRYRREAVLMSFVDKNEPRKFFEKLKSSRQKLDGSIEFWIRAVLDRWGEQAAEVWIGLAAARPTTEEARAEQLRKLRCVITPETDASRQMRIQERERQIKNRQIKNLARLNSLEDVSSDDWIKEAVSVVSFEVPEKDRLPIAVKIFNKLPPEDRESDSFDVVFSILMKVYAERNRWDLLLESVKRRPPLLEYLWTELFALLEQKVPEQLDEFIAQLPESQGHFHYNVELIDMLLRTGHIAKAERNVGSLGVGFAPDYRLKVDFYKAMLNAEYRNVDKIVRAYRELCENGQKNEDFDSDFAFRAVLGTEHLAMIAIKSDPATALNVSRRAPDEFFETSLRDDLGSCVAPLLLRSEIDLAVEICKLATVQERENARPTRIDENWGADFPPSAWAVLERWMPNDPRAKLEVIRKAVADSNKKRALQCAKRTLVNEKNVWGLSEFVDAGWEDELLELAKEVQVEESNDPSFALLPEFVALQVAGEKKFKDAEEAIAFAERYLPRERLRIGLLLDRAIEWTWKVSWTRR